MGESTGIAWTDHTFNPWWGCERVSPGCQHCYAEAFAKRTGNDVWGKGAERRFFGDKHWAEPLKWNRQAETAGERRLVFCASMADVFEDRPELPVPRTRLYRLIWETPHLTWQLLTKRPQNVVHMVPPAWLTDWPTNVWIGTTVEDQLRADERIDHLIDIPARVRFLSCEPLLGRVDLKPWLSELDRTGVVIGGAYPLLCPISWVIAGGESGPKHRPLALEHARILRDQCDRYEVPFFFKQVGGRTPTAGGDLLNGVRIKDFPACAQREVAVAANARSPE